MVPKSFEESTKNIGGITMFNNWIANNKMKKLLKYISDHPSVENLGFNFLELYDLFFPKFKKVKDCIIIAEESVDELEMFFDKVMKTYKYKIWYEFYNTETRIDCHFEGEVSMIAGTQIALIALEIWALKLKQMEPDSKFYLILFSNEDHVEIRFHKFRENEGTFFTDDLDSYHNSAVGYVIV